jgi:hypothetical protein
MMALSFSGFQGSRVTSDGGLLLVRELDEGLGFGNLIDLYVPDSRGRNNQPRSATCCYE